MQSRRCHVLQQVGASGSVNSGKLANRVEAIATRVTDQSSGGFCDFALSPHEDLKCKTDRETRYCLFGHQPPPPPVVIYVSAPDHHQVFPILWKLQDRSHLCHVGTRSMRSVCEALGTKIEQSSSHFRFPLASLAVEYSRP